MSKFEVVSKYVSSSGDTDIPIPTRGTAGAAGYDFVVAQDTIIPSYGTLYELMDSYKGDEDVAPWDLDKMAHMTKSLKLKPTLVPTGIKCNLETGKYLELSVRSSTPLKYWLILANSVGIIDCDYYNNPDNEGEIFFQLINLSPVDIILHKGDKIGQGIIKEYCVVDNDKAGGERLGGFGSTTA